ncbi:MAG: cation transporter [Agathobacter sp.]|nr:cation transporter [Agathobacter sp.]
MIKLLQKVFRMDTLSEDKKRSAYGKLCGIVGIAFNILLFLGKLLAGLISHSIAITADAFNNLSDAGTSVVTLAGFKLAEKEADTDHPFGHGRMEYLAGLSVAGVIFVVGFELLRDSIDKIIHPTDIEFSWVIVGILVASILVKCYMAFYNFRVGKEIDSATLRATGTDSLNDCISTAVVLAATLIGHFTNLKIDGYCGVAVAILIFIAGINAAKEILDPLLGQAPEKEFVQAVEKKVLDFDENIVGVHDLIVHDYGPGRRIISLHAEVPAEGDILILHDIIDMLEMTLKEEFGCLTTIHMDPVVTSDERVTELKQICMNIAEEVADCITIHDFRVVFGESHTNLIFDIVIPYEFAMSDEQVVKTIQQKVTEIPGNKYFAVICVDKATM